MWVDLVGSPWLPFAYLLIQIIIRWNYPLNYYKFSTIKPLKIRLEPSRCTTLY